MSTDNFFAFSNRIQDPEVRQEVEDIVNFLLDRIITLEGNLASVQEELNQPQEEAPEVYAYEQPVPLMFDENIWLSGRILAGKIGFFPSGTKLNGSWRVDGILTIG